MPLYTDVVSSRLEKYREQLERSGGLNDADIDFAILKFVTCQLVDASFGGGGGGGGGGITQTQVKSAIESATNLDQIEGLLTTIATNTGGGGGGTTIATVSDGIDASVDIGTIISRLTSIDTNNLTQANVESAIQSAADIDTIITRLTTIATNTGGGGSTVTANAGTNLNTSLLALESGGNIETLATSVASLDIKTPSARAFRSAATITRAANTTTYIANDVYGGAFELTNIGIANQHVILTGVRVIFNLTALPSGMAGFLLYLYSVTPPSAIADNGAFSVPVGDRGDAASPIILTPGGISLGNAVVAVGAGSVVAQVDNLAIQIPVGASASVFGYLVSQTGFTPVAASETAVITALTVGV